MPLNRRTFLHGLGSVGAAALANNLLVACGERGRPLSDEAVVNLLWSDVSHAYAPLLAEMAGATGIEIIQTIVPYNQRLDKINTAVLAGADIDVIQMDTGSTAQFAAAGWVKDLTDRLPEALLTDIPAPALAAVSYKGRVYGIPLFNSAKHLFYNQRLLDAAGFDGPPTTLDELVVQAQQLTRPGQWGSIWSWRQSEALVCDWLSILFTQAGAQFLDERDQPVFNTMGGTEALQWMIRLLYEHRAADPASLECIEDDVRRALQTGMYALTYNWEGVLPEANDPAKSLAAPHIRVALLPGGSAGKSASVSGAEGWAILTHSRRKAAAWRLLAYMASPDWQRNAAIMTGNYPILASLYHDRTLQQAIQDFPIYGEQFEYLVTRPQLVSYTQISDILQTHLHRALLRKVSPRAAMDAAVDDIHRASATP
jgi:multiple sugar transport system substrate-binding protein